MHDILEPIEQAPTGPEVGAFFDMDGTLLAGFTAFVFAQDRLRSPELADLGVLREALAFRFRSGPFENLLRASARLLAGHEIGEVESHAADLFRRHIAALIYPEARAMVEAHRRQGHHLVLISAATNFQVGAIAADLGFDTVLCNRLADDHGLLTGDIVEPIIFGETKAALAAEAADRLGIDLTRSFAYADGAEDIHLLESVGWPRPMNPDRALASEAHRRGWDVLAFDSRGRPPLAHVVRTVAANAAMVPAVTAGLLTGALNRDRRQALNLAMSTWGEFAVAVSGVDVDVEGEANLWSHRPSVFLFNHQSNFDSWLLMKLLRKDVTAVAKKQLMSIPFVGQLFTFGDVVFIDRTDHDQAVGAMHDAAETIRAGLSIAVAPEGTRQPTPRLGPFKKGAFHLAIEAGVPMVPIVIHNSHDVMPRGSPWIRPTKVRVTVLDPIPTEDWSPATLDDHVADVRGRYLETLGQAD